ncbi:hypothetical protein DEI93_03305 [Curtobacterium sp. MCBD17_035]|uniref:hypothetical protein n=1 Tax=Curtobacterium sp. MCBD17_035 TaxID=2175673 RepID=UPI000DA75C1C|nr:hypothetical protein [Curtobacterium sp. MCBD17_035]WIB68085.1 hypothetical protein DEI93_03305 [Curtobacterium sp. MCBD17_035]
MTLMTADELLEAEARLLPNVVGGEPAVPCGVLVERYVPSMANTWWWHEGRHVFRLWVLSASPKINNVRTFLAMMRALSRMMFYAEQTGLDLDVETLFTDRVIDTFITQGLGPGISDRSRTVYRSRLRAFGEALLRRPPRRRVPPTWGRFGLARPYTPSEVDALFDLPRVQRTPLLQRFATGWIALCIGGGIRSGEVRSIAADDLVTVGGVRCVRVHGPRERVVPLWTRVLPMLDALAEEHPAGPLAANYRPEQRDPMQQHRDRLKIPAWSPRPHTERMRITWTVRLLTAGIHINRFGEYSGTPNFRFADAARLLPDRADHIVDDLRLAAGDPK